LIKHERRRERQQRWLAGTGIAAGVAAAVGVTAVGFTGTFPVPFAGGGAPPCPVVSPTGYDPPTASAIANPVPFPSNGGSPGSGTLDPSGSSGSSIPRVDPSTPISSNVASGGPAAYPSSTPSPNTGPSDGPTPPLPSESCGDAARRLNRTLADALRRVAPTVKLTNGENPRKAAIWFQQYGDRSYNATVTMSKGNDRNALHVSVSAYGGPPATREDFCSKFQESDGCKYETKADGTVVVQIPLKIAFVIDGTGTAIADAQTTRLQAERLGGFGYNVMVYRPDGTVVSASLYPQTDLAGARNPLASPSSGADPSQLPRSTPLITIDQLTTIATTPGFTLFP
jgi:hypothetical protein